MRKYRRNFKYKLRENYGALQCQDGLKSAFLNIDGLSDAKLEDVVSFTSKRSPDVFFVLETKIRLYLKIGIQINKILRVITLFSLF